MRVLLDVNVLVRVNDKSFGPARSLLLEPISRKHVILTSADLLIELGRTLRYPRVQALYNLSDEQIYHYVQFLRHACEVVPLPLASVFPIRDIADVHVLKTAVAGEADVICTLDRVSSSPPRTYIWAGWASPSSTMLRSCAACAASFVLDRSNYRAAASAPLRRASSSSLTFEVSVAGEKGFCRNAESRARVPALRSVFPA